MRGIYLKVDDKKFRIFKKSLIYRSTKYSDVFRRLIDKYIENEDRVLEFLESED